MTQKDIFSWRSRHKEWQELDRLGKTAIITKIELETDLIGQIQIPVKAFLKKPEIVLESTIDFGTIQIG
jgi:hypothetical protein